MRYTDDHRRLVRNHDKTAFIETMMELHSHIFGIELTPAQESAELRVLSNNTVDQITGKISTDPEADWVKLEQQLRECYHSIQREMQKG